MAKPNKVRLFNLPDDGETDALRNEFIAKFSADCKPIAVTVFDSMFPPDIFLKLSDIASSFEHYGYNPVTTLVTFLKLSRRGRYSIEKTSIKNSKGEVVVEIPHANNFAIDLSLLVLMFICKGATANKILKKIEPQWVEILKLKFRAYGINTDEKPPKDASLEPEVITLARLARAAPHYVLWLIKKNIGRVYLNYSKFRAAFGRFYPKYVLSQALSGMVPRDGKGTGLIEHCYAYSIMIDMAINPKAPKKDYEVYLADHIRYVDASHMCILYTDEFRRTNLESLGLMTKARHGWALTERGEVTQNAGKVMWDLIKKGTSRSEVYKEIKTKLSQLLHERRAAKSAVHTAAEFRVKSPIQPTKSPTVFKTIVTPFNFKDLTLEEKELHDNAWSQLLFHCSAAVKEDPSIMIETMSQAMFNYMVAVNATKSQFVHIMDHLNQSSGGKITGDVADAIRTRIPEDE